MDLCLILCTSSDGTCIYIYVAKTKLMDFIFLEFLEVRQMIFFSIFCSKCLSCAPIFHWNKIFCMLYLNAIACFARAQLCNSNFASKLLCRNSTLMAKVNFCMNSNFLITVITIFYLAVRTKLKMRPWAWLFKTNDVVS